MPVSSSSSLCTQHLAQPSHSDSHSSRFISLRLLVSQKGPSLISFALREARRIEVGRQLQIETFFGDGFQHVGGLYAREFAIRGQFHRQYFGSSAELAEQVRWHTRQS